MSSFYWFSSSGRLELELTREQAESASHQGPCDDDVAALLQEESIAAQLAKWEPSALRAELDEYGAWDETELADHSANLARMVWLACGDSIDNPEVYQQEFTL